MADRELAAMQSIIASLNELDEEERVRVLRYVAVRFDVAFNASTDMGSAREVSAGQGADIAATNVSGAVPDEFAELFSMARPETSKEKGLVAAYWAQVVKGQESFVSQALNTELKNLGHGVGNITDALDRLIDERPQLILQLRKEGSTKQARKVYKVTYEGIKRVEQMIERNKYDG